MTKPNTTFSYLLLNLLGFTLFNPTYEAAIALIVLHRRCCGCVWSN
ncbi:hypothetical protein [Planktothrix agardhii]|nr:hypothetical protein [Planktothrix agardhii]MCB8759629.1 hypothetical protein [Planktothrix agardhii 1813]